MTLEELKSVYSDVASVQALTRVPEGYIEGGSSGLEFILAAFAIFILAGSSLLLFSKTFVLERSQQFFTAVGFVLSLTMFFPAYWLNTATNGEWSSEADVRAYERLRSFTGTPNLPPHQVSRSQLVQMLHEASVEIEKAQDMRQTLELLGIDAGDDFNMALTKLSKTHSPVE